MPLLVQIIDLYSLLVLVAVVLSWVRTDPQQPLARFVYSLTEPLLMPIRQVLPAVGGLDFSPMALLFALQLLKGFLQ